MRDHIFGSRETLELRVGPKDPESPSMRRVDIRAVNLHVTEDDNHVYVPSFIFLVSRAALVSFEQKARFAQRPDVLGDLDPKGVHRVFQDGSTGRPEAPELSNLYAFLEFGDITLNVASYLIPAQGRLYLTCEICGSRDTSAKGDIRVTEVSIDELSRTLTAARELIANDYPPTTALTRS